MGPPVRTEAMVQIIREAQIDWPVEGPLELVAPAIKVNVTVSPSVARRRANGYLGSEVAMTLLAHNPRLVVGACLCWRFDVNLCLPDVGVIATLGTVDVDAESGAVLPLSPSQIDEILRRAHALATRIASPTTATF